MISPLFWTRCSAQMIMIKINPKAFLYICENKGDVSLRQKALCKTKMEKRLSLLWLVVVWRFTGMSNTWRPEHTVFLLIPFVRNTLWKFHTKTTVTLEDNYMMWPKGHSDWKQPCDLKNKRVQRSELVVSHSREMMKYNSLNPAWTTDDCKDSSW